MDALPSKVHQVGDAVVEHHSNDNLLKMECFDSYATPSSIRKHMLSQFQNAVRAGELTLAEAVTPSSAEEKEDNNNDVATGNASCRPLIPYLPGLCRVGKNPKSTYVFLAFATQEQRSLAQERLTKHIYYRKDRYWASLPVTANDLAVTNRGAGLPPPAKKREREDGVEGGSDADDGDENEEKRSTKPLRPEHIESSNAAAWSHVSYDSQVHKKTLHCRGIMRQIAASSRINQAKSHFKVGITEEEKCAFLPPHLLAEKVTVLPSSLLHGYRNHVNFSCGYTRRRQVFNPINSTTEQEGCGEEGVVVVDDATDDCTIPALGMMAGATLDGKSSIDPIAVSTMDQNGEAYGVDETFQQNFTAAQSIMMVTNGISVAYGKAVMRAHDRIMKASNSRIGMFEKKRAILVGLLSSVGGKITEAPTTATDAYTLFWKRVQVRHNVDGDVMIDIECDDSNLENVAAAMGTTVADLLTTIKKVLIEECLKVEDSTSPVAYVPSAPTPVVIEMKRAAENRIDENGKERIALINTYDDTKCSILPKCKLVSLQWHFFQGPQMCPPSTPRHLLYSLEKPNGDAEGESTLSSKQLEEKLCGYKFRLSPTAFFQVNTPTAAAMLDEVATFAKLSSEKTTLLDLCCGTGIIGICLSKYVKKVVGIEMIADAIEDAKINAEVNGVNTPECKKATYYAAKVEDALSHALNCLSYAEKEDVVVIFDPPRAGMHPSVLKAVRGIPSIRRIVYISCDQNALLRDVPPLTKEPTNNFKGIPFGVVGGMGVDLFPHTPHVEMIAVLQRRSVQ